MKRRNFLQILSGSTLALGPALLLPQSVRAEHERLIRKSGKSEFKADVIIAGGGLGGCAAALAALRNGLKVVLTEETDWIGGQISQQGVPPDEHRWIETHGSTKLYRKFRKAVRDYYKQHYPLTEDAKARENLNPGDGGVSRLCHEPRVTLAVLMNMLLPFISSKQLTLLFEHKITGADVTSDKVRALKAKSLRSGDDCVLSAPYFIDATELGDLLPLTKTEFVTGQESRKETRELHAPEKARPDNHQAFTVCFAMDYVPGANNVIDKPRDYNFWRDFVPKMTPPWPGKLLNLTYSRPATLEPKELGFNPTGVAIPGTLNLWLYRRIINKNNFTPGTYAGDTTIVNWPQNDYLLGNLVGVSEREQARHIERAKQLSLSLFYWLQTEVPRPDGGQGWPGLRLRGDLMGTEDGMAKYPYVRESRRIKALFTVLEEHVGTANRALITGKQTGNTAAKFYDSIGVGSYHIDLHPSSGGDNYIDFGSLPFQIPLGALLPQRVENLIPANKNIGTTHITNGCYRLHPVEWNIGESAGELVAYALQKQTLPRGIRENKQSLEDFQKRIQARGVELDWPRA